MTARLGSWRWRCALCVAFGFADTRDAAHGDFLRHYMSKHRERGDK